MIKFIFENRLSMFDVVFFVLVATYAHNVHWFTLLLLILVEAVFSAYMNRRLRIKRDPWK